MTLRFLTAGESHGPALIALLEGLPAGIPVQTEQINRQLARRQKGYGAGPRQKLEQDEVQILSGVMESKTTGAPLALCIENKDHARWKEKSIPSMTIPRPGHADLAGAIKYGYTDLRPSLERASARETAARVAVGALCMLTLAHFGIRVGGYVVSIGTVEADLSSLPLAERLELATQNDLSCPSITAAEAMHAAIRAAMESKNTLGGVIEVAAFGLPAGLGSFAQWDRKLDGRLAGAVMSIPAIKGVEIGPAFANTRQPGTFAQDAIYLQEGQLGRKTLFSGGVEAGVTTGQPLLLRAAFKPIPTTLTPQESVNLATGEPALTQYERSDFCPVPRAVVIVESMVAFTLLDALIEKIGGDSLEEMLPRFHALRQPRLEDVSITDRQHTFWGGEG